MTVKAQTLYTCRKLDAPDLVGAEGARQGLARDLPVRIVDVQPREQNVLGPADQLPAARQSLSPALLCRHTVNKVGAPDRLWRCLVRVSHALAAVMQMRSWCFPAYPLRSLVLLLPSCTVTPSSHVLLHD